MHALTSYRQLKGSFQAALYAPPQIDMLLALSKFMLSCTHLEVCAAPVPAQPLVQKHATLSPLLVLSTPDPMAGIWKRCRLRLTRPKQPLQMRRDRKVACREPSGMFHDRALSEELSTDLCTTSLMHFSHVIMVVGDVQLVLTDGKDVE